MKLHQRYLVKGEDVLNEWHMEKIRRRTGSGITLLHGPYLQPPERQARGSGPLPLTSPRLPLQPPWCWRQRPAKTSLWLPLLPL